MFPAKWRVVLPRLILLVVVTVWCGKEWPMKALKNALFLSLLGVTWAVYSEGARLRKLSDNGHSSVVISSFQRLARI